MTHTILIYKIQNVKVNLYIIIHACIIADLYGVEYKLSISSNNAVVDSLYLYYKWVLVQVLYTV